MRRTVRGAATAAAVGAIAFASMAGCSESEEAPGVQVADLTGTWIGTWTGPGSSGPSAPPSVGVLELIQGSGRVVGGFRIVEGAPFYGSTVYQGSFQGDIVRGTLSFQLDFGAGSYRGTAQAWGSGVRTLLALEYAGASCCGYPTGGSDTLARLDSCPAEHTVCVAPSPYCADLLHDGSNCGACGYVCAGELFCDRGRCAWPPTPACTGPLPLEPAVAVEGLPSLPGSYYANDVVLADLNGDGHLDAAVAHDAALAADDDVVSVLLNDGAGTLLPGGTFPVAGRPISLAVGDFDGDGVADLASLGAIDRWPEPFVMSVGILLGTGDGSFGPPIELPAGTGIPGWWMNTWQNLAAGDLDGDGRADLATVNPADETLTVFLSTDGFAAPTAYAARGAESGSAVADLDGDGYADVAIGMYYMIDPVTLDDRTGVLVFRGNGDGTLREGVEVPGFNHLGQDAWGRSLAAGDVDRDGHVDLVQLGMVSTLFLGRPDGAFAPSRLRAGESDGATVGALADFDGDGTLDLVTNAWGARTLFYGGDPGGSFLPALDYHLGREYRRIAAGDLDGDGRLDLVLAGGDPEPGSVWVTFACSP